MLIKLVVQEKEDVTKGKFKHIHYAYTIHNYTIHNAKADEVNGSQGTSATSQNFKLAQEK